MNGKEPLHVTYTANSIKKSILRMSKQTEFIIDRFIDYQLHLSGNRSLPFQFTI